MLVRLVSIVKGPTWLSGLNMVAVWTDMTVGRGGRSRSSQLGRVSGTCRACSRSHVGVYAALLKWRVVGLRWTGTGREGVGRCNDKGARCRLRRFRPGSVWPVSMVKAMAMAMWVADDVDGRREVFTPCDAPAPDEGGQGGLYCRTQAGIRVDRRKEK